MQKNDKNGAKVGDKNGLARNSCTGSSQQRISIEMMILDERYCGSWINSDFCRKPFDVQVFSKATWEAGMI